MIPHGNFAGMGDEDKRAYENRVVTFFLTRLPAAGRFALANALHPAFLAAAGLCAIVFVISLLWVREVPLRRGYGDEVPLGDEASPQPAGVRSGS